MVEKNIIDLNSAVLLDDLDDKEVEIREEGAVIKKTKYFELQSKIEKYLKSMNPTK